MKNWNTERALVVTLFVLVLITFSLAQRDSKRLDRLYTTVSLDKKSNVAAVETIPPAAKLR